MYQNIEYHTEPNGCEFFKEYADYITLRCKESDKSGFAGSGINETHLYNMEPAQLKAAARLPRIMIFSVL